MCFKELDGNSGMEIWECTCPVEIMQVGLTKAYGRFS